MVYVVRSGNGDVIERMWRLVVSARGNEDEPEIWRLTDEIVESIRAFYRLGTEPRAVNWMPSDRAAAMPPAVNRFLDIPVDPTTTMPHLLCRQNIVYHL